MNQELIDEYKKQVDMSLIRASLKMTVEERLQRLEEMARLRDAEGLSKAQVDFILIGGFAAMAHGSNRFTADVRMHLIPGGI